MFFRLGVGINTNMALESLNRYIKKEKLKDKSNIRVEMLLNILEEVVEDKMWKRIIFLKRPHRNTYQGRMVVKAHKKAKEMIRNVEETRDGQFLMKSSRENTYYRIGHHQCVDNCPVLFCQNCKICFHTFTCECVEYTIKSITCKHVHAVAMYVRLKLFNEIQNPLELCSSSITFLPAKQNTEISEFLNEKIDQTFEIGEEQTKKLFQERVSNYINQMYHLDTESFKGKLI